ncbi:Aromatic-L-amino-acid decarboxylase [Chionoecetes opilio]|uniref:Aromatic-L-amino-acid decarboxylase n=1 Tax=Chionoecetes opilio TaxID=41210 RepID=A0A8J4Y643_CHIOP|nr:Aromatic-L-amino-acid decarboxylase [Chionoecetes opilio]
MEGVRGVLRHHQKGWQGSKQLLHNPATPRRGRLAMLSRCPSVSCAVLSPIRAGSMAPRGQICQHNTMMGERFKDSRHVVETFNVDAVLYLKPDFQGKLPDYRVCLAKRFEGCVKTDPRFQVVSPVTLGLVTLCLKDKGNEANEALLKRINDGGIIHMIPAKINDLYFLRTQNWEELKASLRLMLPWIYDNSKYGRWMVEYWLELSNLPEERTAYMRDGLFSQSITDNPNLRFLQSGVLASTALVDDFESAHHDGEDVFRIFCNDRMLSDNIPFYSTVHRNSRRNFSNPPPVIGDNTDKVIKSEAMENKAMASIIALAEAHDHKFNLINVMEYRVTDECLPIYNVNGTMRKTQKSKEVDKLYMETLDSKEYIHQSLGAYAGGRVASPTLRRHSGGHHARAPMQAPFPYQAALDKKHQLAPATSLVGAPLASSTPDCLLQIQPDGKDRFQGSVPHVHIAEVGADGLCRFAVCSLQTEEKDVDLAWREVVTQTEALLH